MTIDRRRLLKLAGLLPLIGATPRLAWAVGETAVEKADYTIRIGNGPVELAPMRIV